MSQPELRRRMRGNDAMFLYFERKEMPLHIGSVAVLDGTFDEPSERLIEARLPEIPRYRQRVVFAPMNLTHPVWEDDPAFEFSNHIRRVRLASPGTDAQLSEMAGCVFTELMDRTRPLWDLTIVDGLEGGRSAIICRVHHCMVDGISGIGLVNVLFDTTKTPREVQAKPWAPPPLPTAQEVLVDGLSSIWGDAAERLIGTQLTLLRIAQGFTGETKGLSTKALLSTLPDLLRPTDKLPFNRTCSGIRGHCWTHTSFGEARAIRSAIGGTINDVVLTVITGAVMRYVNAHREPLRGRFVRMMVPVNLRSEDPHGRAGNEISMIPLSVPLDVADPAERLREVARRSAVMKTAHVADIIQLIGTGLGWTPPALQQPLAALPFMPQPVPIVNMVCTNVPGPMVPLYCNGRQLLTYYPHVPCGSDVGISVAISSYNQNLYYGVTYDGQAAPDGELFRDFVLDAYEELRDAAGVRAVQPQPARAATATTAPEADVRAHRQPERAAEPVPSEVEVKSLEPKAPAHGARPTPPPLQPVIPKPDVLPEGAQPHPRKTTARAKPAFRQSPAIPEAGVAPAQTTKPAPAAAKPAQPSKAKRSKRSRATTVTAGGH